MVRYAGSLTCIVHTDMTLTWSKVKVTWWWSSAPSRAFVCFAKGRRLKVTCSGPVEHWHSTDWTITDCQVMDLEQCLYTQCVDAFADIQVLYNLDCNMHSFEHYYISQREDGYYTHELQGNPRLHFTPTVHSHHRLPANRQCSLSSTCHRRTEPQT